MARPGKARYGMAGKVSSGEFGCVALRIGMAGEVRYDSVRCGEFRLCMAG